MSAATDAPRRTTALAFWLAANARKGAAARERAVCPVAEMDRAAMVPVYRPSALPVEGDSGSERHR
jgi:hypothetical protein